MATELVAPGKIRGGHRARDRGVEGDVHGRSEVSHETADGKYLGVVDLSEGEAPAPGSAAAKAAAPPKPVKSTGDPRLDAKRAKAKAEAERRETERAQKAKAKEKARREAAAARSSIAAAEVQFYRDTVSEMAKNYNANKLKADDAAKVLAGLETDYLAQREANRCLR